MSRKLASLVMIVALLVTLARQAAGATPVSVLEGGRVGSRADVLEDVTAKLTAVEVASAAGFVPLDRALANRGHTTSAFWLRLRVDNPEPASTTVILELAATASRATVYDETGDAVLARSGADLPFHERQAHWANVALRWSIPPHVTQTVLVRIESRDTTILDPTLWSEPRFLEHVARARLLDGIYYGIILGLAFYNLFLAFATRERAYLAYFVFQMTMATANATIDKYTFAYVWPNSPLWALRSEPVFGLLAIATALLSARWMLDSARYARAVDRWLIALGVVAALLALVAATHDMSPVERLAMTAVSFVGITSLVVAAWMVARSGSPHGRIFLVAWSLLFVGTVSAVLYGNGATQSLAGYDLLKIGSAAEALLLSIGLAARIRTMQAERVRVDAELAAERARRIESLSLLVASVAHELGNPLNFAQGGAEAAASSLVEPHPKVDAARRGLALVESGLARIRRILEHLRADLGERQARAMSVDVKSELEDALEVLSPLLSSRRIVVHQESQRVHVRARAGDLAQIFTNLARNALDAMPDDGVLEITTQRVKDEILITFADNGPGVPAEIAPTIFDPFFTTRASSKLGVGLGLYVSKEIAARWGGSIRLVEGVKEGATFVVKLPVDQT